MNMFITSALKNKRNCFLLLLVLLTQGWVTIQAQSSFQPIVSYDSVSSYFSVLVNGKQIKTSRYKDFHYAAFQQNGKLQLQIRCSEAISQYTISPLSKKISGRLLNKQVLQFELSKPSYLVVKINNRERLFLFGELPQKAPAANTVSVLNYGVDASGKTLNTAQIQKAINETAASKQTLLFPAGIYKTGSLFIPSHSKIVLDNAALLKASGEISDFEVNGQRTRGFINILNAENVSITGYGTIDGNGRQLRNQYGDRARLRLIYLNGSKNVQVKNVVERDPGSWNTQIQYCENILFDGVKLLNDADLANTDGFDPDASSNVTIQNSFAYCGDDNVAIKITQENGLRTLTSDITVQHCVFLTRKSSLKVGTESRGSTIKNILFQNNDVILSDRGMALYCSDGAVYENILYVNNRFEENYADSKQMGIHFSINKRNADSRPGIMKNILIDSARFYQPFPKPSEITGLDEEHTISLTIRNFFVDDKKITSLPQSGMKTNFVNIKWNQE
jgi:hypothetical protein